MLSHEPVRRTRSLIDLVPPTRTDDDLFERILLPLAGLDDADRTVRTTRPYIESGTTLIVPHVTRGAAVETTVKADQDQFAQTTYEMFASLFDRSDVQLEWVTLEGREIAEAVTDAVEIVDATVIMFTPREQGDQRRPLTGDPRSQLIHGVRACHGCS